MIVKVLDVFKDALGLAGVVRPDETPAPEDVVICRRHANMMLDKWSANNILVRSQKDDSRDLVSGVSSITIGPSGCDWTTAKPVRITDAWYRDDENNDWPLRIFNQDVWDALEDKNSLEGAPEAIYYDPGDAQQSSHKGTIWVYPIPDTARVYTLHISSTKYFTELVNPTDTLTFEPVYYEAIVYNLACRIFHRYHSPEVPIPQDIVALAKSGLDALENLNSRTPIARMDELPSNPNSGGYDIFSDSY